MIVSEKTLDSLLTYSESKVRVGLDGTEATSNSRFDLVMVSIFVPTPHEGGAEELYTQMGFFCSVNFGRSIYSS